MSIYNILLQENFENSTNILVNIHNPKTEQEGQYGPISLRGMQVETAGPMKESM